MLPNGAVALGNEACEYGCRKHSRMVALQWQVVFSNDAVAVGIGVCKLRIGGCNMRSRIALW